MGDKLLDFNAYDTWLKGLPSKIKGFNKLRKEKLPEYDFNTENPYEFAKHVWQFISNDEEKIDKVVKLIEGIIKELQ